MFFQFIINGIVSGFIIALSAMGFGLVYNTTRLFHIVYAVLFVIPAYFIQIFIQAGVPFGISLIIAGILSGILNCLVELLLYRPLIIKRNSFNTIMVASIGLLIILTNIVVLLWGNDIRQLNKNISTTFQWNNIIITYTQLWQFFVSFIILGIIFFILRFTRMGITIKALHDDPELLITFGINIINVRRVVFFISGILAGIVSGLIAYDVGIDPYVGLPIFLNALVAFIIGGFGNFRGPLLGGLLLGCVQGISIYFFESRWVDAITFLVLILLLIFRPQGILGEKQRLI